jgi:transposase
MKCPRCGFRAEKVPQLPSKAPFSKRFEEAVGQACESASARQVARRMGHGRKHGARDRPAVSGAVGGQAEASRRYGRWASTSCTAARRTSFSRWCAIWKPASRCGLARTRKKETLDEFFRTSYGQWQRKRIEAACVDMWEPFRLSIEQWAPQCKIVYDKFHIMQHANDAIDEVRKAEFFRQGKLKARA